MPPIHGIYARPVATDRTLVNLDLNLLVTLDVLLRERNVTRTAGQLGLSQPAVSAALARLRRHFGDDLLVRHGNRYEPTPLALRLAERTPQALAIVRTVFDAAPEVDPSTMEREFTVIVSDYAAAILGPALVEVAAEQAPGVRLRLQQTNPYVIDHAAETLRVVDGVILPQGFLRDLPHLRLWTDRWVCLVDGGNPEVGDTLTLDNLRTLPWVSLYRLPTAYSPSQQALRLSGVEPVSEVIVDSFLAMPFLVAGSPRVAWIQSMLACRLAPPLGVRVLSSPVEPPLVEEAFWYHPMYRNDPAHQWLRGVIVEAVGRLPAVPT